MTSDVAYPAGLVQLSVLPRNYYVGECGCRVPQHRNGAFYIRPCPCGADDDFQPEDIRLNQARPAVG